MTSRTPLLGVSIAFLQGSRVLLIRRAKPPFQGLWSLPGGRVEFGETLRDAVCREAAEETGLHPEAPRFVRVHEAIDAAAGVHAVIAVFAASLAEDAEPVAMDDAQAVTFLDRDALRRHGDRGNLTPGLFAILDPLLSA